MNSKTIIFLAQTEYHILLFINYFSHSKDIDLVFHLYIPNNQKRRFTNNLNFHIDSRIQLRLIPEEYYNLDYINTVVKDFTSLKPVKFCFFQELDISSLIIAGELKKTGTEICLFQDGTKAYFKLKKFSLSLFQKIYSHANILNSRSLLKSRLSVLFNYSRYAKYDFIDVLYLTFPESYNNWNNKKIEKIKLGECNNSFKDNLERVFYWSDYNINLKDKTIFYITQPMHDDGFWEMDFLDKMVLKFSNYTLLIKPHPNTNHAKLNMYKNLSERNKNVEILDIKLPAELFILNMHNSIIISINSTAQFLHSPLNRSYYIYPYFADKIERLQKVNFDLMPNPNVKLVSEISEID